MAKIVARYGELRVPVAILYGRAMRCSIPNSMVRRPPPQIPGGTITLIDGGHMLPVTKPAETEAWLRQVLDRGAQATGAHSPRRSDRQGASPIRPRPPVSGRTSR